MGKTVLVTGGTGFLGAHICRVLAERGDRVIQADLKPSEANPPLAWLLEPVRGGITFLRLDTENITGLIRACQHHGVESMIHASAITDLDLLVKEPAYSARSIIGGALNVMETARLLGIPRVIYISSIAVYSAVEYEPMDEDHTVLRSDQRPALASYTSAKLSCESLGLCYWGFHQLDFVAVRLSAVYGLGMNYPMYIKPMVEESLNGKAVRFSSGGDMIRDYTYISDVVSGIIQALDHPRSFRYRIFNLSSGEAPVRASELARVVRATLPEAQIEIGPGMTAIEEAQVKSRGRLSIERARREFGYAPRYSLSEGVRAYVEEFRAYQNSH